VLAPGGLVVVYDFSPGRSFRDSAALEARFSEFVARYPSPHGEALVVDPERLGSMNHPPEIRSWCSATLPPVWEGYSRKVLFRGYYVCLSRR
jgi:hypothetical protein